MSECVPINDITGIIRDTTNTVFRVVLPLLFQVATNVALVLKLKRVSQMVNKAELLKREKRFAITITILNTIYACSNLLSLVSTVLINVYGHNQNYTSTSTYESSLSSFIFVCFGLLNSFVNCDLVFFVNLVSNKTYRQEAKKIFLSNKFWRY
jgi:hypothetical protein